MQRITAIFHGRVQGVGFRSMAKMIAEDLGAKGYVQNLPDGTVKLVAEGEEDVLGKFLEKLKSREIFGKKIVKKIDVSYEKATGEFEGFEIKRD